MMISISVMVVSHFNLHYVLSSISPTAAKAYQTSNLYKVMSHKKTHLLEQSSLDNISMYPVDTDVILIKPY